MSKKSTNALIMKIAIICSHFKDKLTVKQHNTYFFWFFLRNKGILNKQRYNFTGSKTQNSFRHLVKIKYNCVCPILIILHSFWKSLDF